MLSSDISFSEAPRDKSLEWNSGGKQNIRVYFNSTDAMCFSELFLKMKTRLENQRLWGVGAFPFQNMGVKWPV